MNEQFDFRALLIKLQDCLSEDDRRRLHFLVGDAIPRQIRDDPSLTGTLNLLESLFDQQRINEQDFDYLIHAFSELRCYDAVKRLKEHQQHHQKQSGENESILKESVKDDVQDKMSVINFSRVISSDISNTHESISIQNKPIIINQQNSQNSSYIPNIPIKSKKNPFNVYLKNIKQLMKSRLTIFQFVFFILNIIGIITVVVILIYNKKASNTSKDVMLIKVGFLHGNGFGGDSFNDAEDCSLTFNDRLIGITAGWSTDKIGYITFTYSNGKSKQHGRTLYPYVPHTDEFELNSNEFIDGVTVYTGIRGIFNPFQPNGSFLVVGLRFHTNQGRQSELFGSSNGTEIDEYLPNYTLSYARGQAFAYIDALQFIWYKEISRTSSAILPTY
ncbi:unnamed protein product [Rotaria sp. Silwood2]|nr:unnamed protein product [Rotaria sp. Silwood2]CAF2774198.1 unnamed protein product [Rotaria sp. Silwood2]CAF3201078.1 unnamed protein product [Rotaria sp. Silwood2]CAF3933363.1 unnamed protein product [Rotaria sp. Silwood2]CAF3945078.1 unnamed protein product [Rotaria sp. Silwood2]